MSAKTKNMVLGLIDDDDLFRAQMKHLLEQQGYVVLDAPAGDTFFAKVQGKALDCILLDYNLGSETGFHVYERIKNSNDEAPPVIMLTANEQQPIAVKAFRSGVVDFVVKRGLRIDALVAAVDAAIQHRDEVQLRDKQMALLKSQYALDLATGLFARHEVEKRIVQMATAADRRRAGFAMIFVFIPSVQAVSDRFGYVQGDRALRTVASRFRESMRACDQGGRVDDAVFVCLVDSDVTAASLSAIEASIAKALTFEFRIQAASFDVDAQIKTVRYPEDGGNPLELMATATSAFEMPEPVPAIPVSAGSEAAIAGGGSTGADAAPKPDGQDGSERRESRRHRVFKGASIIAGASTFDCTIRDMSETGARLRVPEGFTAPARFDIKISDSGERHRAAVRWQVGTNLGVEYVA